MRLFKRGDIYYAEIERDVVRSLKTKNKKEATLMLNELKRRQLEGKLDEFRTSKSLGDLQAAYMKSIKDGHVSKRTVENHELAMRVFVEFICEDTKLNSIRRSDMDRFVRKLAAEGKVRNTINFAYIAKIVSQFKWAEENEMITKNPFSNYKKVRKKSEDSNLLEELPKYLEVDEIIAVRIAALSIKNHKQKTIKDWYYMIELMLYTGARRSDILHFTPTRDIDLVNDTVLIYDNKNRAWRTLPIHPELRSTLEEIASLQVKDKLFNYQPNWVSKKIKDIIRKAGIDRFEDSYVSSHLFRHTFISILAMAGLTVDEIADLSGHKDTEVIRNIYRHVNPNYIRAKFSNVLFNSESNVLNKSTEAQVKSVNISEALYSELADQASIAGQGVDEYITEQLEQIISAKKCDSYGC